MLKARSQIGTLRETALHASLKRWYTRPGDRVEASVDGYVVDLVRDALLIEIQTRGLSAMRPKIIALLARGHPIRVVHPIAIDRWIVNVAPDGTALARRRSPKHGTLIDLAAELVGIPELLAHPRLEIEVLLTREEEIRRHEPGRCWRRRGWMVIERRLVEVIEGVVFARPADLARLLPDRLPTRFTTADLAGRLGSSRRLAQQLAYCLRGVGLIEASGRQGRAVEYQVVPAGDEGRH